MLAALLGCSLIFGLAVIWLSSRERLALYHPLVILCLWHVISYLYFPWKIYLSQEWDYLVFYKVPLNNDLFLIKTLLLVHCGFLAVILGYRSGGRIGWSRRLKLPPIVILPRIALWVGLLTLALAGYAIFRYHSIPGVHHATATFLTKDALGRGIYTGASGYTVLAPDFLIGVGLIWYLVSRQENTRYWQWLFWGLAFAYLFLSITRGWHRSAWVTFLFGLTTMWLLMQHRHWPTFHQSIRLLPVVVLFLLIFNISGADRGAWRNMIEGGVSAQEYIDPAIQDLSKFNIGHQRDMSNFEYNVFQISVYPELVGYERGRTYINSWFVSALPRVLFPDKDKYFLPINISTINLVRFTVGPATGLYVDFYRNFGIPGLIVGCFLFGIALRIGWQVLLRYAGAEENYHYIMLLFSGLVTFLPQLLRDGLGSLALGYFLIMTPIFITIYLSRRYAFRHIPVSRLRKAAAGKPYHYKPVGSKGKLPSADSGKL